MAESPPVPFSVLPPRIANALARKMGGAGAFASSFFPRLLENLLQAEITMTAREYSAFAIVAALSNALAIFLVLFAVGALARISLFLPAALAGVVVGFASFATIILYPEIIAMRRARQLEARLIPALRQLLIELRSGVPLFNSMVSVSSDYGEVSDEFRKIVRKMDSGTSDIEAISEAARLSPSMHFRKVLWQMSNALRVGSSVAPVLESMLEWLTAEKVEEIRKYGKELSPITMAYLMTAVIIPSLGIAIMTVITGLLGVTVPSTALAIIFFLLAVLQMFFINLVATRRPVV